MNNIDYISKTIFHNSNTIYSLHFKLKDMKIQAFFLLLSVLAFESFSLVNGNNQAFTNVYHYRNSISLKNFDNTRSTIYISGNSATLFNPDGSQSIIRFCGRTSMLIAADGSNSSVFHNGFSSRILKSDGTQIFVSHMSTSSSCSTANGKHTITHTFGNSCEGRYKKRIDVLIHMNWLMQKEALEATEESDESDESKEEEEQN